MTGPLVVAGIGNTMLRAALVEPGEEWPVHWRAMLGLATADFDPKQLPNWLPAEPVEWYVASVHRPTTRSLAAWVAQHRPTDLFHICQHQQLPLRIGVEAPERVGMDRLITAVAANRLRDKNRPAIVVDAGTAVTVDAIDRAGTFQGGAIMPGIAISARALAEHTDLLPEVECRTFTDQLPAIGAATEPAIRSGLFFGCVGAVRELIRRMSDELGEHGQVFVTGGDARALASLIDEEARFIDDLGLQGLVAAIRHSPITARETR